MSENPQSIVSREKPPVDLLADEVVRLRESLERRGEQLGFSNILALSYVVELYSSVNGQQSLVEWFRDPKSDEEIFTLQQSVDLGHVLENANRLSAIHGITPPPLSTDLTVPQDQLAIPRTPAQVDQEILDATETLPGERLITLFRYVDTVGWRDDTQSMEPDEIRSFMDEPSNQVINHARGLRFPVASIEDARGIRHESLFALSQLITYPRFVLDRTDDVVYSGLVNEPRHLDILREHLLLSERESLARSVQRADKVVAFTSASVGSQGLCNWGFFCIEMQVPERLILNVRDLCIQGDEVMGDNDGVDPDTRQRLSLSIHSYPPPLETYQSVGGIHLDEMAVLGGIRREWVRSVIDIRDQSIVWQKSSDK